MKVSSIAILAYLATAAARLKSQEEIDFERQLFIPPHGGPGGGGGGGGCCTTNADCGPYCIFNPYTGQGFCSGGGGGGGEPTPSPPTPSPEPNPCCDNPNNIPTKCEVEILIKMMEIAVAAQLRLPAQWLRASFHDAGTFNQMVPGEGGAKGCLMNHPPTLAAAENNFLDIPVATLETIRNNWENHPDTCIDISSADILQFAGLFAAIRQRGVPGLTNAKINELLHFKWGRKDEMFCDAAWTHNLPGFQLGTVGIPARCMGAGIEIKTKMMARNGFTEREATALIGAHTIGLTRGSFGPGFSNPWVKNGGDTFTLNGPVFDNAFHDFLENTIVANNIVPQFVASQAPLTDDFGDWFRDPINGLNHLDTDVILAFDPHPAGAHPNYHVHTIDFANDNVKFLKWFFHSYDKMSKLGVIDPLFLPLPCENCTNTTGVIDISVSDIIHLVRDLGKATAFAEAALDKQQFARLDEIRELTTQVNAQVLDSPVKDPTPSPVRVTKSPVKDPTPSPVTDTKPPVGEITKPPVGEITKPPVGEITKPPVGEITKPPVGEITKPPVGEITKPPVGEITKPPVGEITKSPVRDVRTPPPIRAVRDFDVISARDKQIEGGTLVAKRIP